MSANRIYLVCSHHPNPEDALLICERADRIATYEPAKPKKADEWFLVHRSCGRGRDHFQLAYHRPQDHDRPLPAEDTVAGGVKLAMAINGTH